MENGNLFTHIAPKGSYWLIRGGVFQFDWIGIQTFWFFRRGESQSMILLEQGKKQQQTHPKCDAGSANRTRTTLVGGEHSHHLTTPAPQAGVARWWTLSTDIFMFSFDCRLLTVFYAV